MQSDHDESVQPPQVTAEVLKSIQPIIDKLPGGYRIEVGANAEESAKANAALAKVFPIMFVCMLVVIIFQVRSLSALTMTILTAPLGLAGVVPTLLIFHVPFGFNPILGLIALAGILMRNTLILIGQIKTNKEEGLDDFHAVVEATVQRSRPVVLTALAAVLAFIPLTFSVFWGSQPTPLSEEPRSALYLRSFSSRALHHLVPRQANRSRTGAGGAACLLSGRHSPVHEFRCRTSSTRGRSVFKRSLSCLIDTMQLSEVDYLFLQMAKADLHLLRQIFWPPDCTPPIWSLPRQTRVARRESLILTQDPHSFR